MVLTFWVSFISQGKVLVFLWKKGKMEASHTTQITTQMNMELRMKKADDWSQTMLAC